MNERMLHPTTETLEAYAGDGLDAADGAVVRSHLLACQRCENVVEEWRSLFQALASLPRFAPPVGFGDRVLAHVRIPQPWHARASAAAAGWLPGSTRGWALAAALLALPVLVGGTLLGWLLSKSYVTTHGLWVFTTDRIAAGIQSLVSSMLTFLMQTDVAAWLTRSFGTVVDAGGARGLGLLAVVGGGLTIVSIYVLYTNLFRSRNRDSNYVMFSF